MTSRAILAKLGVVAVVGTLACSGGSDAVTQPQPQPQPQAQVGTVSGLVTDDAGSAVSGASVTLSATGKTSRNAATGSDGKYAFSTVDAGNWTVSVSPPNGFTAAQTAQTVTVAGGQTASANFTLTRQVQPPPQGDGSASVSISGFAFNPVGLTVAVGTTVTWTNNDNTTHTVTGSGFDSGDLGNKSSFTMRFNTAGTFSYHCAIHPGMTGSVTVQ